MPWNKPYPKPIIPLWFALAAVGITLVLMPALLFAQDVEPTNWLDLFKQIQQSPAWYVIASIVTWGLLQFVMGRSGFKVPWLSDKLNDVLNKRWKAVVILVLSAAAGALTAVGSADAWTIINAGLTGLSAGIGASGIKSLGKAVVKNPEVE